MVRLSTIHFALMATVVGMAGCATRENLFPGGFDPANPPVALEPSEQAVAALDAAVNSFGNPDLADADAREMTLKSCLVRAVLHNRALRQRTYAAQRAGLEQPIARREYRRVRQSHQPGCHDD